MEIYFTNPRPLQKARGYIELNRYTSNGEIISFEWEIEFKQEIRDELMNIDIYLKLNYVKNIRLDQLVWISTDYDSTTNEFIDVGAWSLSSIDGNRLIITQNGDMFNDNTCAHIMCLPEDEGVSIILIMIVVYILFYEY